MVELRIVAGPGSGTTVPLLPGEFVIGHARGVEVRLDHPSVAVRHAMVRHRADGAIDVCDLGSRTGTWLDGRAVSGVVALPGDAELRLGAFVVEIGRRRAGDRPSAVDPARNRQADGTIPFNRPPRPLPAPGPSGCRHRTRLRRPRPAPLWRSWASGCPWCSPPRWCG